MDDKKLQDYIKRVSTKVSEEDLSLLVKCAVSRKLKKGEQLLKEGEVCRARCGRGSWFYIPGNLKEGNRPKNCVISQYNHFWSFPDTFFSIQFSYFPLAMLFAAFSGFGMMSQTTISITIIQVDSDKEMRGRVMNYVAMAYFGMLPVGSLLIGAISQKIGAPATILYEGIIALIIAAVFSKFLRSGLQDQKKTDHVEEAQGIN